MKYNLTIGDWSGDGHDKTEVFVLEIPDQFKDLLKPNFERSVRMIGFDPRELAVDYEDDKIGEDEVKALVHSGFDLEMTLSKYSEGAVYEYDGNYHIGGPEGMVAILMHFIGYGLEGFKYEVINDSFPQLFGYWDSGVISSDMIGYGLFY